MNFFFEPVNLLQWNMFEKVEGIGHVECFLATKKMQLDDIIVLHVGKQSKHYESGVYAYGTIVKSPYVLENHPQDYCNEKLTVDVRFDKISHSIPIVPALQCKKLFKQFRTVHQVGEDSKKQLIELLDI